VQSRLEAQPHLAADLQLANLTLEQLEREAVLARRPAPHPEQSATQAK
jgi:hypothetical protein